MLKRVDSRSLVACVAFTLLALPGVTSGQVHTAHDHIPDFAASPTIVSAMHGSWSSASTWSPSRVPGPNDVVRIRHSVTYDSTTGDATAIGIDAGGALRFVTTQTTVLRVGTLMVFSGGLLEIGTASNPVATTARAEVIVKGVPLNFSTDPDQYGTGILGVGGTITIHGAVKSPTWTRLAAEPRAGHTTLTLEQAVSGWQVNDVIIVPDSREDPTRNNDAQVERRTIQSISGDGRTITLSSPLSYTHPGARDLNGSIVFLPHVMNLTRNVLIRSEAPTGTRGHTLYTARSTVDIRFAEYRDLGRTTISPLDPNTNHIGRYAMHAHHLYGPPPGSTPANGYQFTLVGNAVWDSSTSRSRIKWPMTLHGSHYGLVQGNTVYNGGGAGIATEDGSESYNVIERNMVVRILGEGDRMGTKSNGAPEAGSQGIGFWFRGVNNYVRNNVAANAVETGVETAYGFEYFQYQLGNVKIPNFQGADTSVSGEYTTTSSYTIPVLEFSGNETYSNPQGLTYWWIGMDYIVPQPVTGPSIFKDLRVWHTSRYPIYAYEGQKIVFDGLRVYGDVSVLNDCCDVLWYGDYKNVDAIITRSTIVGIDSVVLPYHSGGTTVVEDSFIAAINGIVNQTSGAPGTCPGCPLPDRKQIIRNVRFAAVPGAPLRTITMRFNSFYGTASLASKDEVYVYDYQGQAGNQFRAYYYEQATQNIAGGFAACNDTTSRPEVKGFTCPLSGTVPPAPTLTPPAAPTNLRITR